MTAAEARAWLEHFPADMPVFVLVAQDRLAPGTVRDWMARARACGSVPPEKVASAEAVAVAMTEWAPRRWPD